MHDPAPPEETLLGQSQSQSIQIEEQTREAIRQLTYSNLDLALHQKKTRDRLAWVAAIVIGVFIVGVAAHAHLVLQTLDFRRDIDRSVSAARIDVRDLDRDVREARARDLAISRAITAQVRACSSPKTAEGRLARRAGVEAQIAVIDDLPSTAALERERQLLVLELGLTSEESPR